MRSSNPWPASAWNWRGWVGPVRSIRRSGSRESSARRGTWKNPSARCIRLRANGCTAVLDYLGLIAALQIFLERLSARNSREAEVLQWVAEGQTNNQSGETLGIRLKTSKNTGSP